MNIPFWLAYTKFTFGLLGTYLSTVLDKWIQYKRTDFQYDLPETYKR